MSNRVVTENDLRRPEYKDQMLTDFEFRADGKIVRKDRFEKGMQEIAWLVFGRDYEIPEVVEMMRFYVCLSDCVIEAAADSLWDELKSGGLS